jgi:hypothetical protein
MKMMTLVCLLVRISENMEINVVLVLVVMNNNFATVWYLMNQIQHSTRYQCIPTVIKYY